MSNFTKHIHIIMIHRKYVRRMCFKMGIPFRGLIHDLSKYSPTELSICKYYNGGRSPHEIARAKLGYSPSWYHHKNRNKHHWEYWLDNNGDNNFTGIKIPFKYVIEMFCDYTGASKAYGQKDFTMGAPLAYHLRTKDKRIYHPETLNLLTELLQKYADSKNDKEFVKWYKTNKKIIKNKYKYGGYENHLTIN